MGVSDWGMYMDGKEEGDVTISVGGTVKGGKFRRGVGKGLISGDFYHCFSFWSEVIMDRKRTGNCVISSIFGSYTTISIAVEAGHGLLREEGKRLLVD